MASPLFASTKNYDLALLPSEMQGISLRSSSADAFSPYHDAINPYASLNVYINKRLFVHLA